MVAELGRGPTVFDIVGRPTSQGLTWVWAQDDLDSASVGRARTELGALFSAGVCPHRVLVYLGAERFVDLRGLRLLLDVAARVRDAGGALAVVAPPHCLTRMNAFFALEEELPMIESIGRATWWARTCPQI